MLKLIAWSGVAAMVLGAGPASAAPAPAALIADALGAAPAAVARGASVMSGDGKVLRKGSNGWTCMPDNPATPGRDPMCLDKAGLGWAMAWMGHKAPPTGAVGMAYMLKGGTDANNVDPYMKHAAGKPWIVTGPHVMILSAAMARESGYPGGANPDTSKPYVMFGGTPYAHIMLPVR
ncbi:MAG: hypothetical protein ABIO85_03050 [Sphingomicrobium sp.]